MRQKAIEFLKSVCKNDENSCVNYKPYENGSLVESISFSKAIDKFMKDYEEMKSFAEGYNLDENNLHNNGYIQIQINLNEYQFH